MENTDIINVENPVKRRGRPGRIEVKPQETTEVAMGDNALPERRTRRVRQGGGVLTDRTVVPEEIRRAYPDCEFFWENDEKGKVELRVANGWEVVKGQMHDGIWHPGNDSTNMGSVYSMPVGPGSSGQPMQAVLLCIPSEWYQEDVKAQEEYNRQVRNSLRRGSNPNEVNSDGTYAPRLPNGKIGLDIKQGQWDG